MKKASILFLIVIILSALTFLPVSSQGTGFSLIQFFWGVETPVEVSPGDTATLSVVLRYEGLSSLSGITAKLALPPGFSTPAGLATAIAYHDKSISHSSIVQLRFTVVLTYGVMIGLYKTTLALTYPIYANQSYVFITTFFPITLEVSGKPNIFAKTVSPATLGNQQLAILVENTGDAPGYGVAITGIHSNSIVSTLDRPLILGTLDKGEGKTVSIGVMVPPDSKSPWLALTVELRCQGPTYVPYTFSQNVQVPLDPTSYRQPVEVDIQPRTLPIGILSQVSLSIKNTGDSTIARCTGTFKPDSILRIIGQSTFQTGPLEPNKANQIQTQVYVPSTTVSTASLTTSLTYYDPTTGITITTEQTISLLLKGLIELSLADIMIIPSSPVSGKPFSITATFINTGTGAAYSSNAVPITDTIPVKTLEAPSTFIGTIEANALTSFTMNLQLLNTTLKSLNIPIVINYRDNLRTSYQLNFTVPISIEVSPGTSTGPTQPTEGTTLPIYTIAAIIIIAVAAVAGVALYLRRKKRPG